MMASPIEINTGWLVLLVSYHNTMVTPATPSTAAGLTIRMGPLIRTPPHHC